MRTRIPMLVLSLIVLVVTLGVAPQTSKAAPVVIFFGEDPNVFGLTITGGPIIGNAAGGFASANNWQILVNVVENGALANDLLSITGTAFHSVGPHGEGPNPVGIGFNFFVNAANFAPGVHVVALPTFVFDHGEHFDQFNISVSFTIANGPNRLDIAAYRFDLTGVHTASEVPIPEPATLILLGTGLAALAARARRRRKIPRV